MVKLVKSGLLELGIYTTKRTEIRDVLCLIEKLQPQQCGKELIRIGSKTDGGYLIPDDLAGIEYCFSPGVNTVSDFENHLADLGIKSFLADYSVDGPAVPRPEFVFDKKFLGSSDREPFMTLASWKERYLKNYTADLILQMDIEGWEYEVIFSTPDSLLDQFRIMVIEFHYLDRHFDPFVFSLFSSCIEKILQHFHVAHIHPNNIGQTFKVGELEVPQVMEFTFFNKRRVASIKPQKVFPHKLDIDNTVSAAVKLPECWYSRV
jgi:hypothetical protein